MKLSPKALGLTIGILFGICLGGGTLLAVYTGYLQQFMELFVGIYPYYTVSLYGAVAGLIWGFIDGFLSGIIFAWIYNVFAPGSVD
ncbi:bacteriophage holin [Candidatus Peregrinibacteria bacterium]|nr:bacteriophage holin [Candidatus Peregrinibacteria bacterium]